MNWCRPQRGETQTGPEELFRAPGRPGEPQTGLGARPPCCPLPPATPREALQERLQRFAGAAQTDLGCLVFWGGGAMLGTAHWGALPGPDSAQLRALLEPPPGGAIGAAARDFPVFLPNGSPQVPHRLLQLPLVPGWGWRCSAGPAPHCST
ncbi:protein fuzzy homolog isoform X1 [Catharus ustulatus]|uniref:protein fuzzy homolog isoform X1 n=1 Tax=Catharus ustulatus TaxID=91951 RepID=UPI00140BF352|nr:protein fuzzy homolog isoform X1 [Catharus ustulatus]